MRCLATIALKAVPLYLYGHSSAQEGKIDSLMHKKGKAHLNPEFYQQDQILICRISDEGIGRTKAEELKNKSASGHKSAGIKITESRIANTRMNGSAQSVEIRNLVYADVSAAETEVFFGILINVN